MADAERRRSTEYVIVLTAFVVLTLAVGTYNTQLRRAKWPGVRQTPSAMVSGQSRFLEVRSPLTSSFEAYGFRRAICLATSICLVIVLICHKARRQPAKSSASKRTEKRAPYQVCRKHAKRSQTAAESGERSLGELQVRHIMSSRIISFTPITSVKNVKRTMAARKARHVLVCTPDYRLIGVICDRDLGRPGDLAKDVMTPYPDSVTPETTAAAAVTKLIQKQISCLPVVENDRVRGIITATDIMLTMQSVFRTVHDFAEERDGPYATRYTKKSGSPSAYSLRPAEVNLLQHAFSRL